MRRPDRAEGRCRPEDGLNGEDLDERIVFEVERDDDAPESRAHSAVISVTAARAEGPC